MDYHIIYKRFGTHDEFPAVSDRFLAVAGTPAGRGGSYTELIVRETTFSGERCGARGQVFQGYRLIQRGEGGFQFIRIAAARDDKTFTVKEGQPGTQVKRKIFT